LGWTSAALALATLVALPTFVSVAQTAGRGDHWSTARRDSAGLAPDPSTTEEAVVQVYGARTWGWRGALAVHTWIAIKRQGAAAYERHEVIGWRLRRGMPALVSHNGIPDAYWFGSAPELYRDIRGDEAKAAIARIEAAIAAYPWKDEYVTWPGPNSNTFVAWVAREAALGVDLPPTAIGKDFTGAAIFTAPPGGAGLQFSLFGLLGLIVGLEEGIEVNLLGLSFGLDLNAPALRLPALGRIGF
jgi:hypothetical protein